MSSSSGAGCGCEQSRHRQQVREAAASFDCPSGAGGDGEALRGNQGLQPQLAPTDSNKQSGSAPGASSGCEWWLWHQQRVQMGLAPAAGANTRQDCGAWEQRIFSNHQRLAPMTATGTPPWSGVPAHLLYHPTIADACHVPHAPLGGQCTS
uniref:Uncharacterized protein n=1 Tax=Myotis myotis TaxID=51298 RepID=A0A7J7Z611_MYOMY|nr:hypothetical protein mMyoMyo1_010787 [Myotis myotis]